ncbi:hypothetical protein ACIBI9_38670 [Nonomuraea sp. NPDC050451]|uniref:hypothetical protein n=1 Tax=Nonomuraea sp. NPDC050451 TaxID=3364364 RepID=UPI00378B7F80
MMDIQRKARLCLVLAATAVATVTSAATEAATNKAALSWHSSWFVKTMCYKDTRSFAQNALSRNGFKTAATPPNAVLASDNSTVVEVSYAPAQTSYHPNQFARVQFTVTAMSNDSNAARTARNRVRENIQKQRYIDTC